MIYSFKLNADASNPDTLVSAFSKMEDVFASRLKKEVGNPFKDIPAQEKNRKLVLSLVSKYVNLRPKFVDYVKVVAYLNLEAMNQPVDSQEVDYYYINNLGMSFGDSQAKRYSKEGDPLWVAIGADKLLLPGGSLTIIDLSKAWPVIAAALSLFSVSNRYDRWAINDVVQAGILLRESSRSWKFDGSVPFISVSNIHPDNDRDIEREYASSLGYSKDISSTDLRSVMEKNFGTPNPQSTLAVGPWQMHWSAFRGALLGLGFVESNFSKKDWILSAAWPWWVQFMLKDSMVNRTISWKGLDSANFKIVPSSAGSAYAEYPVKQAFFSWAFSGQPAVYGRSKSSSGLPIAGKHAFKSYNKKPYIDEVDRISTELELVYDLSPYSQFSELVYKGVGNRVKLMPNKQLFSLSDPYGFMNPLSDHLISRSLVNSNLDIWSSAQASSYSSDIYAWLMSSFILAMDKMSLASVPKVINDGSAAKGITQIDASSSDSPIGSFADRERSVKVEADRGSNSSRVVQGPSTSPYFNFNF